MVGLGTWKVMGLPRLAAPGGGGPALGGGGSVSPALGPGR